MDRPRRQVHRTAGHADKPRRQATRTGAQASGLHIHTPLHASGDVSVPCKTQCSTTRPQLCPADVHDRLLSLQTQPAQPREQGGRAHLPSGRHVAVARARGRQEPVCVAPGGSGAPQTRSHVGCLHAPHGWSDHPCRSGHPHLAGARQSVHCLPRRLRGAALTPSL